MLVCLEQSEQGRDHSDMRVDPDQAEPQWPWGELEIPPRAERKPQKDLEQQSGMPFHRYGH